MDESNQSHPNALDEETPPLPWRSTSVYKESTSMLDSLRCLSWQSPMLPIPITSIYSMFLLHRLLTQRSRHSNDGVAPYVTQSKSPCLRTVESDHINGGNRLWPSSLYPSSTHRERRQILQPSPLPLLYICSSRTLCTLANIYTHYVYILHVEKTWMIEIQAHFDRSLLPLLAHSSIDSTTMSSTVAAWKTIDT